MRSPRAAGPPPSLPCAGAAARPRPPTARCPKSRRNSRVSPSVKRRSAARISASSPARRSLCNRSGRSRRVARTACTCWGSFSSSRVSCMSASGEVSSCRSSMTRNVRSRCSASSDRTLSPMAASLKSGVRGQLFAFAGRARGLPDGAEDGQPELLGVLLIASHLDDCQPVRLTRTVGPGPQQRSLAAAGGGRDERYFRCRRAIQGREKLSALNQPRSCLGGFWRVCPKRHA